MLDHTAHSRFASPWDQHVFSAPLQMPKEPLVDARLGGVDAALDASALASSVSSQSGDSPDLRMALAPEEDASGNVEYKLQILPPTPDRFDRLVTQLNWRLMEGAGTSVYEIGVMDDGSLAGISQDDMRRSLAHLCAMAQSLGATAELTRLVSVAGTSARAVEDQSEAQALLLLHEGLPEADAVGVRVDRGTLRVHLVPEFAAGSPAGTLPVDIPRERRANRPRRATRRLRRLARFEEAIRTGRGWHADEHAAQGDILSGLEMPLDMAASTTVAASPGGTAETVVGDTTVPVPVDDVPRCEPAPDGLRLLAEVVIRLDEDLFVDFSFS